MKNKDLETEILYYLLADSKEPFALFKQTEKEILRLTKQGVSENEKQDIAHYAEADKGYRGQFLANLAKTVKVI